MKLLYLGGLQSVHLRRWLRYFVAQGHEVHVLTPPSDRISAPGVQVHVRRYIRTRVPFVDYAANAAILPPQVLRFRGLIRRLRPDLVHVHYLNDAALISALARVRPLVFTAWGSEVLENASGSTLLRRRGSTVLRRMLSFSLGRADLITCDAVHVKRALIALGADASKIVLVYFGTDTDLFHPTKRDPALRARLGLDRGPTIISTRLLDPIYDVNTLVAAFPNVLARHPSARLVIGGTGPEHVRLQDLARSLGITPAVRFVGWISEQDMPRYLASCDVYVSTALTDGGIAASTAEAMACGLPVVVTGVADNREWVQNGIHGFVVPPRDPVVLASRIISLLDDGHERVRLGQNGRALIKERNNFATEMSRMAEYYRGLVVQGHQEDGPEAAGVA